MQNHLDILLTRIWEVTVVRSGDQSEYLVPEDRLGTVIDTVTSELNVQHLSCVPRYRYHLPHAVSPASDHGRRQRSDLVARTVQTDPVDRGCG